MNDFESFDDVPARGRSYSHSHRLERGGRTGLGFGLGSGFGIVIGGFLALLLIVGVLTVVSKFAMSKAGNEPPAKYQRR